MRLAFFWISIRFFGIFALTPVDALLFRCCSVLARASDARIQLACQTKRREEAKCSVTHREVQQLSAAFSEHLKLENATKSAIECFDQVREHFLLRSSECSLLKLYCILFACVSSLRNVRAARKRYWIRRPGKWRILVNVCPSSPRRKLQKLPARGRTCSARRRRNVMSWRRRHASYVSM